MPEIRSLDVAAPDGRVLRAYETGPVDGPPVMAHHGTPGAGRWSRPELESAAARGLRLLTYDRPGYADSSPAPGRAIIDAASDVALILDALGIDRFATYGTSGGGPHALACAALLPGRCAGAATIAGVGPADAPDLDWTAGMGEGNLAEFAAAQRGREHLMEFCALEAAEMVGLRAEDLAEAMRPHVSPVDAAALTGEFAEYLLEESDEALRPGVEGWVDDDLAFLAPWGFDLAAMTVPTLVLQGNQDLMVPGIHGLWLGDHIAGAQTRFSPVDGHITLFLNHIGSVHDWVVERLAG